MNKKGDVPFGLVPFVAIALFGMTFLFLLSYKGTDYFNKDAVSDMFSEKAFAQKYVLESAKLYAKIAMNCPENEGKICNLPLKERIIEISKERDLGYVGAWNFFAKLRSGDFSLELKEGVYEMQFNDLFVKGRSGESSVKVVFDLSVSFNEKGETDKILISTK